MRATVKTDIRTGKVYSIPFATVKEARCYLRGVHKPYRGVLLAGDMVECWQEGALLTREQVSQ